MLKTRVIPCLLLKRDGLVKTIHFKNANYIGDPINAARIYNEKEVDELIFLDIEASIKKKQIKFELLYKIATECFMPLCYGGGIRIIQDMKKLFKLGIEKIAINSAMIENPLLIQKAANLFGSQSIVCSIDVKKNHWGQYQVYTYGGTKNTKLDPVNIALQMEKSGAGELLINSIDKDGTMSGYEINLLQKIANKVSIPIIACGGAGNIQDLRNVVNKCHVSAVAAGSLFVYYGKERGILINYPSKKELEIIDAV